MVVDYLSRFMFGTDLSEAFSISFKGAAAAEAYGMKNALRIAIDISKGIKGLDDNSVICACKLSAFDVCYRNPIIAMSSKGYKEINPDKYTIENIQTLVKRTLTLFEIFGPVIKFGFTFEPEDADEYDKNYFQTGITNTYGGYTTTINKGDGDFLTSDTLWELKVSKRKPTSKHTLQLLIYWIMGQHSGQDIYKCITKLAVFNPRLNTLYQYRIENIPESIIRTVEREVICY